MTAPLRVVSLSGSHACADRIAARLGAATCPLESRRFPDGEIYLRVVGDVTGCDVAIVAQLRDPDPQIPGLLFLADALRELGALRVGLVAHRHASLDALYRIPTAVVPSAPAIAAWLQAHVAEPYLIGPDEESRQWVSEVAALAGCPHAVLRKHRHGDRDVEIAVPDIGASQGRTPVIVDDIIASAHTIAVAARQLLASGLAAPVCIGVHAVFAGDATEVLQAAGGGANRHLQHARASHERDRRAGCGGGGGAMGGGRGQLPTGSAARCGAMKVSRRRGSTLRSVLRASALRASAAFGVATSMPSPAAAGQSASRRR
jgi:ribose-phosphate pyrophosphokinase